MAGGTTPAICVASRTLFAERRAALLTALADLPARSPCTGGGQPCIGWLPAGMDEGGCCIAAALTSNLWLLSSYSIEPMVLEELVLGYGDHGEAEMQVAVRKLGEVIRLVCQYGSERA
ncbi:MAG: hypothetical protein R2932_30875 [Caldilineaceae bacterium]